MSETSPIGGVSSLIGGAAPTGSAISLYNKPSADYAAKVQATIDLLKAAAIEHPGKVVQATSLGVEDMIVTDLIARYQLPIAIGTLETGALHPETVALIGTIETHYADAGIHVEVYKPVAEAVIEFVQKNGEKAMYESIDLRKACCGIRKLE
ncbi:MAG TPA: phosphoadenosine phosphosulfate reductase family protein, partial [Aquabacterium sp.]|nr:phosphoadenosine phosphosulfate reductase family protein [Aquabacterium sp.]